MFDKGPDRGPPHSLRGWLSDIYIPVLLDSAKGNAEALIHRLGGRATIDDPIFGRASGLPALEKFINEMSKWLKDHHCTYEKTHFTMGVDRDVTEGTLILDLDDKTVDLPIAVVAERRRSREVELRLYYSTQPIKGTYAVRSPLVEKNDEVSLPIGVTNHLEALAKADLDGIVNGFESEGMMREARGLQHKKEGDLRDFYDKLLAGGAFGGGIELLKGGAADDGRTCALEYTLVKMCGRDVPAQAGLAVYERGDSGLLRSLRVYDDLEIG
jgi:hypothetical protein